MKKVLFFLLLYLLSVFTFSVFGQTPQPNATPPLPVNDQDVLKISTNLVQLDVVVTDKNGNQVTDLKPEDFEIFINGEKQDISNFSYIFSKTANTGNSESGRKNKIVEKYNVPPPPAKLKLEEVRRTYAIIVDDLGLSFTSIPAVKDSIRKFINEQMQAGDLVAIVRTASGAGALQSFTSDKRQLLAAVDRIKWNAYGRGGVGVFEPIRDRSATDQATQTFEDQVDRFRNENFAVGTIGSLNYVISGMRELPGRKAAMVFSEGFALTAKLSQAPNQSTIGLGESTRAFQAMRVLADLANRSSVVIYTLDPRGLQVPEMWGAQDEVLDVFPGSGASTSIAERSRAFSESQQSLRYLAYETGGIPFVNQNDLTKGLRQAVDDQSGYYLIGYQPDSDTFDPNKVKFNKVSVKVNRDDLKVRYRSGFFGVTDKKIESVKKTPQQQIYGALLSPFGANDISLNLATIFAEDAKKDMFIRALVTIDIKNLDFTKEADGIYKANFDIVAATFGDNGTVIDEKAQNYTIKASEKEYQKRLETGLVYNLLVPVKKPGAYQFRVALRDAKSAKVGSASQFIEIPNLKKNKLMLSSIVLDNYTTEQWQKISTGSQPNEEEQAGYDMAQRRFKRGTILRYDYVIYNAKSNPVQLNEQIKLFRDGQLVVAGKVKQIVLTEKADLQRIQTAEVIRLPEALPPGNYALQIIVTDNRAKENNQISAEWIDFEIIE